MLIKTRGIVLSFLKYRETSIIARVYTERLGVQSYVVNGVRKAKPPGRIALFQPFTLLDLVAYVARGSGGLTRLSEFRCSEPFSTLPYEVQKSSVVLFLSEVVGRAVREEEQNEPLFQFLHDSILAFDQQTKGSENFALVFLLELATYLGFGISTGSELTDQVIMAGHAATSKGATGPATLRLREFETYFDELLHDPATSTIPNGRVRHELLTVLIRYYQLHVEQLGEIRSLDILSQVLAE
ncbi:DNA repair protein RecO [Hymenobacter arizonensis]|uniref:DNA repair protein RecO n=1 Tax=Hymenobacter arizonensis TaxID=1227077 RepID=A0A1I5ZIH3_HYMAR|nr:DNA repair protein RecO [Hymenobacter arizonensis]SFQ56279.1 DNA replication and repair protein RecO [Hymenobacter arizonensis]